MQIHPLPETKPVPIIGRMKAAAFQYVRASDLSHALHLLEAYGGEARPIAGGQSLVPMMAMRLAQPAVLVDINRLSELKSVSFQPGMVTLGAAVRQRDVEHSRELLASLPLVGDALSWVGHIQTRNRGTLGGSLAHADPSAELPLAAVVLDCQLILQTASGGERRVPASEFFLSPMVTAHDETELLVGMAWPTWEGQGLVSVFDEVAIRHGDFAMASVACQLQFDRDGICRRAALGLGGIHGTPLAFPDLAAQLLGCRIDQSLAEGIADEAVSRSDPGSDQFADREYRRHLGRVLMTRALTRAAQTNQSARQGNHD